MRAENGVLAAGLTALIAVAVLGCGGDDNNSRGAGGSDGPEFGGDAGNALDAGADSGADAAEVADGSTGDGSDAEAGGIDGGVDAGGQGGTGGAMNGGAENGTGGGASGGGGTGGSGGAGGTGGQGGSNAGSGGLAGSWVPPDGGVPPQPGTVDLLFMVDSSGSMIEEQVKLRNEFPRLITILTTGDLNPYDGIIVAKDFNPATDLHLGVVSADMGLPGVQMNPDPENKCEIGLGDDGLLQNAPNPSGDPTLTCASSYPLFLSYAYGQDVGALAKDFACIATLGTDGCGFEMQLESLLKALWPSDPVNLSDPQKALNITFYGGAPGHGDAEHIDFLRGTRYHSSEPDKHSLLAIVVLTDENDCSAGARGNLDMFEHPNTAPPEISAQPANLRCYYDGQLPADQQNRYPLDRYVNGFRSLRQGYEHLVVFAAITGIPPDIVEDTYDLDGDGSLDAAERNDYYDAILNDPTMQETIRADGQNLEPACTIPNPNFDPGAPVDPVDNPELLTKAYPARRIVGVARGFGSNGVVRSICEQDFSSATNDIVRAIARHLTP